MGESPFVSRNAALTTSHIGRQRVNAIQSPCQNLIIKNRRVLGIKFNWVSDVGSFLFSLNVQDDIYHSK